MPIYEYMCRKCNAQFALMQKMGAAESDTVCPHCDSEDVKKMLSAFSCNAPAGAGGFGGGGGCGMPSSSGSSGAGHS
jgi:putative FmdB family regulatory protein